MNESKIDNDYSEWVKQQNALTEESRRVERWWATYNAAIMGGHAFPGLAGAMAPMTVEQCHDNAVNAANLAHGELPK